MVQMSITVPAGISSGQPFQFRTPDGRVMQTTVPAGVHAGGSFIVDIQMPGAAPPVAAAVPVPAYGAPPSQYGAPSSQPTYTPPPRREPAAGGLDRCAAAMAGCSLSGGGGGGSSAGVPMGMPVPQQRAPTPSPGASMRSDPGDRSAAERHAECPICFEPLHKAPVGVFLDASGKRVSHHFYRLEAAREWLSSGNGACPLTRAPVHSVLPVPDIRTDPDGWFRAVDIDGDRKLSRFEVVECLKAQLAVDNEALDNAVNDPAHWMWQQVGALDVTDVLDGTDALDVAAGGHTGCNRSSCLRNLPAQLRVAPARSGTRTAPASSSATSCCRSRGSRPTCGKRSTVRRARRFRPSRRIRARGTTIGTRTAAARSRRRRSCARCSRRSS